MAVTFKSRPDAIGKMVGDAVVELPAVTMAFFSLVSAKPEARAELAEAMHTIETDADERYIKFIRKVASTFITPYDREDLYRMIEALDDVVDALDFAGHLIVDLEFGKLPDSLIDSAKALVGMAEQAREATTHLKKPAKLEKALFALNAHENDLDVNYRKMMREVLVTGEDPIYAMKLKLIADEVEMAATKIELFSRTLAVAAIKET